MKSVVEKRRQGLVEIRDLWERPVLPFADDPELVPTLEAVEADPCPFMPYRPHPRIHRTQEVAGSSPASSTLGGIARTAAGTR